MICKSDATVSDSPRKHIIILKVTKNPLVIVYITKDGNKHPIIELAIKRIGNFETKAEETQ